MTDLVGYLLYAAVLVGGSWLLASFKTRVYAGERTVLTPMLRPVERALYGLAGISPDRGQGWAAYATSVLAFNAVGFVLLYAIQRLQGALPLNPDDIQGVSPDFAFNTAVSFVTNTNWQACSSEVRCRTSARWRG